MEAPIVTNEHQKHDGRRLGRRRPSGKPALRLRDFLTGAAPTHPTSADHFSRVKDWGMYRNDVFGICGPTSAANSRKLTTLYCTGTEVSPSQDEVNDLYRRSGNPGFTGDVNNPGDDNGVDMQEMCEAMMSGGLAGVKPLAFAKVDVGDLMTLNAGIDAFGFVLYGATLETAQQTQTDSRLWDYSKSAIWGGHATLGGRYQEAGSNDRHGLITWAEVVDMTDSFMRYQLEEAWAVIWPEIWDHPNFDAMVDKQKFANAYQQITGKPFPVDVPPTPAPQPLPTPAFTVTLKDDAVVQHVRSSANRGFNGDVDAWATSHFKHYFKV